jgi:hypothetical protein
MSDTDKPQIIAAPSPADRRHCVVMDANFNAGSGVVPFRRGNFRYVVTKRGIKAIREQLGVVP